jgi:neutral trehalase
MQTYYLNRSQPPVLAAMIELYMISVPSRDCPGNLIGNAIKALKVEHKFWTLEGRTVKILSEGSAGLRHSLTRYCPNMKAPRPESYKCASSLC